MNYLDPAECVLERDKDGIIRIVHCPEICTVSRDAIQSMIDTQNQLVFERNAACNERSKFRSALIAISEASGFDNINGWARNIAKEALK